MRVLFHITCWCNWRSKTTLPYLTLQSMTLCSIWCMSVWQWCRVVWSHTCGDTDHASHSNTSPDTCNSRRKSFQSSRNSSKMYVSCALMVSRSFGDFFIPYTSIKIIKNEIGCRDDTVPKTVGTRRHGEEDGEHATIFRNPLPTSRFLGVAEDCCMLSILLAVPSCTYSFWHSVIPTSYFIFNDFILVLQFFMQA